MVMSCCSEGCRADDLVLLTKSEPGDESGTPSQPPEVHLLALIERVDIDEGNRSQKIVVGHVNLVSGSAGLHYTHLCVTDVQVARTALTPLMLCISAVLCGC